MNTLTQTVVPTWVAAALAVATLAMLLGVLLLARSKRAATRQNPTTRDEKLLRRLFIAALLPTLIVIGAVMGISFVGLSSFARHDMGWNSWISLIVPLSLDGISITFGFWAFVAVKRQRHPGRSERIVYVGALISAWINFQHGRQEWTGAAGIYLGFLSLASAWMFHELLSQFMDAQQALPKLRRNGVPMFGERWLWAFWSTLMARRAWIVYPPTPDVEPTAANALAHLETVRAHRDTKRLRHQHAVDTITRQLGHTHTGTTGTTVTATAVTPTPIPDPPTGPVPSTTFVPSSVPAVSTVAPATSSITSTASIEPSTVHTRSADSATTQASTPASDPATVDPSVPTPATVATRIGPRTTPSPRPTPAPVPGSAALTTRPRTSGPTIPATPMTPSATDEVAGLDAVQPMLPKVDPALLARATELARQYHAEHGTRIPPGTLAVRLRIPTDQATTLLKVLDTYRSTQPDPSGPSINGQPTARVSR